MKTAGTWLVLIGAALAVIQAVWVITATGRKRATLRRGKARSDAREARIEELELELRAGWGENAATIDNYEDQPEYRPDPDLDRLRGDWKRLRHERAAEDWVSTYAALEREKARNERELDKTEAEWRRLWTEGVPGLVGGAMALVGGVLTAIGS